MISANVPISKADLENWAIENVSLQKGVVLLLHGTILLGFHGIPRKGMLSVLCRTRKIRFGFPLESTLHLIVFHMALQLFFKFVQKHKKFHPLNTETARVCIIVLSNVPREVN